MRVSRRHSFLSLPSRTLAGAIALAVTAVGSGLPMCATLLVQIATPCPMHSDHAVVTSAQPPSTAVVLAAHDHAGACHTDAGQGCVSGGVCPAAGSAAPDQPGVSLRAQLPARGALWLNELAHLSFLAPPLSPPPQA